MRALSSSRVDREPVRIVNETVRISVWAVLLGWLARRLWRLLVLVLQSPSTLAILTVITIGLGIWHTFGPLPLVAAAGVLAGVLCGWWVRWPDSFERWVRCAWRSWWRSGLVYRWRWSAAMNSAGLGVKQDQTEFLPSLIGVSSTCSVDRVRVRMLPGQTLDDYAGVADRLAQTFGTLDCRIRSVPGRVHELELWMLISDPLADTVASFEPGEDPLHDGLPVALAEDGSVWRLPLLGTHVLVVGATGAGKGSVIWSILTALTPSIGAGLVRVWAVDPKGGMELAPGRRLFDRFCYGDSSTDQTSYETGFAVLLEDAVAVMRARQDRLRGVTRLHEPSAAEPLIVLVVDELAALTAWTIDREAKRRIGAALALLLSQGRAVGVVVVGAVQDPRKEVLTVRDLFPTRIALRLSEAEQVNLVLGPGARNRGALCDRIPDRLPGIGYVAVDGISEPVRVRFSHITDATIAQLGHDRAQLTAVPGQEVRAA
jgi:S-DNA-T family DNA segregation ATPase FtsK/SpoIIIE